MLIQGLKKNNFLFLYLISAQVYTNAGDCILRLKKTGEIWVSMKQKVFQTNKLKNTKRLKDKFLKSMIT